MLGSGHRPAPYVVQGIALHPTWFRASPCTLRGAGLFPPPSRPPAQKSLWLGEGRVSLVFPYVPERFFIKLLTIPNFN